MFNRTKMTGLLLGGVAALGITAGATTAFAQSTETSPAPAVESVADGDTFSIYAPGLRGPRAGSHGEQGGEILANALGITPAELRVAMQKIPELAIAKAVENGDITQEQADQMAQGRGLRGLMGPDMNLDQDELLAEALGITPAELATARDNAIPMAVEAGLLTQAQANDLLVQKMVRDAAQTARQAALQQAVEEGLLTQAQADRMLEQGGRFGGPGSGRLDVGPGFGHGTPGMRGSLGHERNGPGSLRDQPGNGPGNQRQQQQPNNDQSSYPTGPDSTATQNSEL